MKRYKNARNKKKLEEEKHPTISVKNSTVLGTNENGTSQPWRIVPNSEVSSRGWADVGPIPGYYSNSENSYYTLGQIKICWKREDSKTGFVYYGVYKVEPCKRSSNSIIYELVRGAYGLEILKMIVYRFPLDEIKDFTEKQIEQNYNTGKINRNVNKKVFGHLNNNDEKEESNEKENSTNDDDIEDVDWGPIVNLLTDEGQIIPYPWVLFKNKRTKEEYPVEASIKNALNEARTRFLKTQPNTREYFSLGTQDITGKYHLNWN